MKKDNHKNIGKEKRSLNVATYIRVGSIEQLNPESGKKHYNLKTKIFQKEEECNKDIVCEKERDIGYIEPRGI